MKREFDEVNNLGDQWIADCKGLIREKAWTKSIGADELSEISGISQVTVSRVLWDNNIRHTVQTIIGLLAALDIRVARIEGLKTKQQPDELPSLTQKQRRAINEWIRDNKSKRKKKARKTST